MATITEPDSQVTIVTPSGRWGLVDFTKIWQYRELLCYLAWRDVKVRYRQTLFGVAWAFIQPFFTMLVFSLFFGYLGGMSSRISGNVPYPLMAFSGLVIWAFFVYGLTHASESLVASANLLKKIYFPRVILPLASLITGAIDFLVACLALFAMMVYYHVFPSWPVVFMPFFLLLAFATAFGMALWLSALNVQYRDVKYTLPFLIQVWLFATPIAYPLEIVPSAWRSLYGLNPMVGVVEGFRWSVLGTPPPPISLLLVSMSVAVAALLSGAVYFRRMEKTFADVV